MSVKMRQEIERKIARAFLRSAARAGFTFEIDNGEESVRVKTAKAALEAMFATDEEHVFVVKDDFRCGWVSFVYGNDGWDVISDYSVNIEYLLNDANRVSDRYSS